MCFMKSVMNESLDPELLLNCSQEEEVSLWASRFKVSPQAVKTAVRACCSNSIVNIATYLEQKYLPSRRRIVN